MSIELEDRLAKAAETLPTPTAESRDRARRAALTALTTAPPRRHRRLLLLGAAVAIVVVTTVAALAAPWRDSPLATERALAALGHQPVIHAIVDQTSAPVTIVVDLSSGRERQEAHRTEYWYDDERDALRVRLSVGGVPLPGGEYLQTREGFFTDRGVQREQQARARLDPALAAFASGYREALDSGAAAVVGEEVVDGRETMILRFPLRSGPPGDLSEEVAVDRDDYRPLRIRVSSSAAPTKTIAWPEAARVVEIETIPRDPRDFEAPASGDPRPAQQGGVDERQLEPADAATALGRPAFWAGPAVAGVELAHIKLMRLTTTWTDGRETESHALVLQYGADRRTEAIEGGPSLIVTEGTSVDETPLFNFGGPVPRPRELRLAGFGKTATGDAEMWVGSMQHGGLYISFQSSRRELIVAAAKAMVDLK